MTVDEKVEKFFKAAAKFLGKEVGIPSGQLFQISELANSDPKKPQFFVQYGFPQSGCVSLDFTWNLDENSVHITDISVYTQPADEQLVMVNYNPEDQVQDLPELGIKINFGLPTGTEEFKGNEAINANPNAMKMLDLAIDDLEKGEILGPCREVVQKGEKYLPVTHSERLERRDTQEETPEEPGAPGMN